MEAILNALADVLDAGAKAARSWPYNVTDQHNSEVLAAMATKARELATTEEEGK